MRSERRRHSVLPNERQTVGSVRRERQKLGDCAHKRSERLQSGERRRHHCARLQPNTQTTQQQSELAGYKVNTTTKWKLDQYPLDNFLQTRETHLRSWPRLHFQTVVVGQCHRSANSTADRRQDSNLNKLYTFTVTKVRFNR